jgi:lysophospholipase L1-like esterase
VIKIRKWFSKIISLLLIIFISIAIIIHVNTSKASEASKFASEEEAIITIYLAGDSTVSHYGITSAPRKGWGQVIAQLFNENIIIKNHAVPKRSSKSFIHEGRLTDLLKNIKKGDYLFIQFGHNDEKEEDPTRYTLPHTSYKSYLKQYIDGARSKGAIPVLITPVERRRFSADGHALYSHGKYPLAMKELAKEENVPLIDLTEKSKAMYDRLGPQKTKKVFMWLDAGMNPNYPMGITDNTHFQEYGAKLIAYLVVEGIYEVDLPLKHNIDQDIIIKLNSKK